MARIKTKDLKQQFLFRVYDEDELRIITQAITQYKDKFESLNDCIKYFVLVGADKLLGNNLIDNSINYSEIRRYMQEINEHLEIIKHRQRLNFAETTAEVLVNQAQSNLITNILQKKLGMNLQSYTPDWKYRPENKYELNDLRQLYQQSLLDGTEST